MGGNGGALSRRGELADELRQLMALRSRSSVRDRACPQLDLLLDASEQESRDVRYLARTRVIDSAIAAIGDPAHRGAATALIGSGEGRWRTVSQRGAEAASHFGCGWDAYRRRRSSGTSQLDDTLDAIAECLLAGAGAAELVVDGTGGATAVQPVVPVVIERPPPAETDPGPIESQPTRATRRPARLAVASLTCLATAVAGWLAFRSVTAGASSDGSASVCTILGNRLGDLPQGADAQTEAWAVRFRAFGRSLPGDVARCAGTIERRDGLVILPVASPEPMGIGALVAADDPDAPIVHLNYLEYFGYRNALDRLGVEMVGVPVERIEEHGTSIVMLTRGAIVSDAPPVSFLVTGTAWNEWNRRGGLDGEMGRPIGASRDTGGKRIQDFEHGRLVIDLADPSGVEWQPITNPASALPTDLAGSLLEAFDGTSWYVDEKLVRHWVPTTNDFNCTLNLGVTRHRSVPAQAIATVPAGEPLRCR
jgi:hypothetical protein